MTGGITSHQGEKVTIPGFGSSSVGTRAAKIDRNPYILTQALEIPEKKVAKFRAGKKLREAVSS